jgi:hypothetical protein
MTDTNLHAKRKIRYSRTSSLGGYECSTRGDVTYSAYTAVLPDGRTIEQWYQNDVKGYSPGGRGTEGKGKPPLLPYEGDELYQAYKTLWRIWAVHNIERMKRLLEYARQNDDMLTDMFAHTEINQARALAEILNEWVIPALEG